MSTKSEFLLGMLTHVKERQEKESEIDKCVDVILEEMGNKLKEHGFINAVVVIQSKNNVRVQSCGEMHRHEVMGMIEFARNSVRNSD